MSARRPDKQAAIQYFQGAAEAKDIRTQRLELATATIQAAIEFGHPRILDIVGHDLGSEVTLDDLAAAAEVSAIVEHENNAIAGLRHCAQLIEQYGPAR